MLGNSREEKRASSDNKGDANILPGSLLKKYREKVQIERESLSLAESKSRTGWRHESVGGEGIFLLQVSI